MRLHLVVDAFYLLGSFWGSSSVCLPNPDTAGRVTPEVVLFPPVLTTAFVDVNVVPMDVDRVLPHQTVLIENGRITALGPANQVRVPASAVRVDGRGKYLMPGLGAMHDHETYFRENQEIIVKDGAIQGAPVLLYNLARNLADGVTAMGSHASPGVNRLPILRRLLATVPSPRLYAGRRLSLLNADSIAADVEGAKAAGYDHFVISYGEGGTSKRDSSAAFDSLLAAARRVGLPVTMHTHHPPFEPLLALGRAGGSADHLYAIYQDSIGSGNAWARLPPDVLRQKMQTIAALIQRAGVWITPTLRCVVPDPTSSSPSVKFQLQFIKVLHDAGVGLLLARDDFWDVHDDLTAMVAAGLSPYQALLTGTRNIAQYFGKLDELGTVAVGKRADLVLLHGNPLTDVGYAREPAGVMVDGRWLDRAALDQALLMYPKLWIEWVLRQRGGGGPRRIGGNEGEPHRAKLLALTDSLELMKPTRAEYQRVLRLLADEFGALRLLLPPDQQREWLDPHVRVWLREQRRQGFPLTVAGVTP